MISEVGIHYKPESGVGDGDEQWIVAVELFNPTDEDVTVARSDSIENYYRIRCGENSWSFHDAYGDAGPLGGGVVLPGERVVLYSIHNGLNVPAEDELDAGELGYAGERFYDVGGDVFDGLITTNADDEPVVEAIRIERHFGSGLIVPVDSVYPDQELGFVPSSVGGGANGIVAMRDDHYVPVEDRVDEGIVSPDELVHGRYRSTVAAYYINGGAGTTPIEADGTDNTLGESNVADVAGHGGFGDMLKADTLTIGLHVSPGGGIRQVYEGFWIRRHKLVPDNSGKLFQDVYWFGPQYQLKSDPETGATVKVYSDLPHQLCGFEENTPGSLTINENMFYCDKTSRARANFGRINPFPQMYPDLPWGTLLAETVEILEPDTESPVMVPGSGGVDLPIYTRIYGRININTATKAVLMNLPWPDQLIAHQDGEEEVVWPLPEGVEIDPEIIADYIIAYRNSVDRTLGSYPDIDSSMFLADTPHALRGHIDEVMNEAGGMELKEFSNFAGFLSPGELAIPLAYYVEKELMGGVADPETQRSAYFLQARDTLYRAVCNLITVNSDSFAAFIYLRRETQAATPDEVEASGIRVWHGVALIDRSNTRRDATSSVDAMIPPAVLMLTEVK